MLLSIRLNPAAIRHLLQQTSARSVLVSSKTRHLAEEAILGLTTSDVLPEVHDAAPFESFLCSQRSSVKAPDRVRRQNRLLREDDRNVLILHSSGTTGLPKPIHLAHRYLLGYAACHLFSPNEAVDGLNLSTLPLYHVRPQQHKLPVNSVDRLVGIRAPCSVACLIHWEAAMSAPSVKDPHWRLDDIAHLPSEAVFSDDRAVHTGRYRIIPQRL